MFCLIYTASKTSGRSGMKMKPYAKPFKAKPVIMRKLRSGRPKNSDGPYRVIEPASIRNEMKIKLLRGILFTI